MHKKQRHTAKRILEVLQEEGFSGGYTIVKGAVRNLRRTMKEVYMPLTHRPGEAQVDFGHALVKMSGVGTIVCKVLTAVLMHVLVNDCLERSNGLPREENCLSSSRGSTK